MKIATHNSGTGESGGGVISFFGSPFSKCQSKTLVEQYNAGVRLFDLRVRKHKGKWVFAHGLWTSKDSIFKAHRILIRIFFNIILNFCHKKHHSLTKNS